MIANTMVVDLICSHGPTKCCTSCRIIFEYILALIAMFFSAPVRKSNRDNLGTISHISPIKHIL